MQKQHRASDQAGGTELVGGSVLAFMRLCEPVQQLLHVRYLVAWQSPVFEGQVLLLCLHLEHGLCLITLFIGCWS